MCLFRKKKQGMPFILYRRERPVVWTKDDALCVRQFMASPGGVKMRAFFEDRTINKIIAGTNSDEMRGWTHAFQYLLSFQGEEQSGRDHDGEQPETAPIQFLEDDEETTTA